MRPRGLRDVQVRASLKLMLFLAWGAALAGNAAGAADCKTQETALVKEESELPRLEVSSPADRPITCITLETIMAFAGRLKLHIARCPASGYVPAAAVWEKTRVDYSVRFARNRCRRTF